MEGETNSSTSSTSVIFKKENGEIDANNEGVMISRDPFIRPEGAKDGGGIENNEGVAISRDPFIRPEGAKDGGGIENNDQVLLLPTECLVYDPKEAETLKKDSAKKKLDDTNRILIDTAAPFESVRAAVSKYGGILDCKAEETLSIEKQKQLQLTLKKVQEEILMYQERFRDEETSKARVLEELDCFKRLVEGLNLRLEREETLEKQAKQDFELAYLRLREVEQGITDDSSVASKAQLDVANERHTSAVAELKSTNGELESIQAAHVSLLRERDIAVEKAADSFAALEGIEQTIHNLALKSITAKQLLESAHAAHLEAQEQTLVASLTLDIENLVCGKLLNHAEEELQQVSEQIQVDEYKSMKCLKLQLSSLRSEFEKEKASLSTMKEREGLTSTSIAFLEAEFNRMNTEFELTRDKMTEMEQVKLLQATKEVEEELRKAKEEAKGVEAEAAAIESRLNATLNEIDAARTSKNWGDLDFSDKKARSIKKLEAVSEKLELKKKELREAMGRIEKAEEERLLMEHELRTYKEEHKHESTTNVGSFDDFVNIGTDRETPNSFGEEADGGYQCETPTYDTVPEPKRRKRMFFARIVMFFAGKKVQSLQ